MTNLARLSLFVVLTICACGSDPPKSADGGGAGQLGDGGEGGSDSGSPCADCLNEETLEILSVHAHDLSLSASLLAGHPSEREMVGFFMVPGLSGEDGVPGSFLIPVDTCSEPTMFDPFCEMNRCSRLACTGEGAGWTVSYWLEEPAQIAQFDFESARVDTTWADGATGIGFELQTASTGPGDRAWDVIGSGTMDVDAIEATETFRELCSEGPLMLTVQATPDEQSVTLALMGVTIAESDTDGMLVPTGSCP